VLTGLAIALFSTLNGSIVYWLACWLFLASATQLVMTTVWVPAVAHHFHAGRKLALSTTTMGIGLSTLIAPNLANFLIAHDGWRLAYLIMGLGWGGLVAVVGFFGLDDHRSRQRRAKTEAVAPPVELPGYTMREGVRSVAFRKILCAGFICSLINIALMFHMVPILSWNGLSRDMAVFITSTLGITMLVGNLGFGLIGERVPSRVTLAIVIALPAISCAILLHPTNSLWQGAIAANIFGLCAGAQLPAFAYLATRYYGLRSLGTLRGFTMTSGAIATAIGPVVAGLIFDRTGGYTPFLLAGIPMLLLSAALLQSLGPYPRFEPATV
jgi:MFS family permease